LIFRVFHFFFPFHFFAVSLLFLLFPRLFFHLLPSPPPLSLRIPQQATRSNLNTPSLGSGICAIFVIVGLLSVLCYKPWRKWIEKGRLRRGGDQENANQERGDGQGAVVIVMEEKMEGSGGKVDEARKGPNKEVDQSTQPLTPPLTSSKPPEAQDGNLRTQQPQLCDDILV